MHQIDSEVVFPLFVDKKQSALATFLAQQLHAKSQVKLESLVREHNRHAKQMAMRANVSQDTNGCRWAQAILELDRVPTEKGAICTGFTEKIVQLNIRSWHCASRFSALIAPYSEYSAHACNTERHRRIVILFTTFIKYSMQGKLTCHEAHPHYTGLSERMSHFLYSTFLKTEDSETAMFALIGLEEYRSSMLEKGPFKRQLQAWLDKPAGTQMDTLQLLQFHCRRFEAGQVEEASTLPGSLLTPAFLLPPDRPFAFSTFGWSTFSYGASVKCTLPEPPYVYFEVLLQTAGSMRIGWALFERCSSRQLGKDGFSIVYDGSDGCIWHMGKPFRVDSAKPWKAGDTVGCLLDTAKKTFHFYHNGEPIKKDTFLTAIKDAFSKGNVSFHKHSDMVRNGGWGGVTFFLPRWDSQRGLGKIIGHLRLQRRAI